MNYDEYIGKKYGRLEIIRIDLCQYKKQRKATAICLCDCGKIKQILLSRIKNGGVISCGCFRAERASRLNYKNGLGRSCLSAVWRQMIRRCHCLTYERFKNWGGRGVFVCEEWRNDFVSFYNWAIENGYKKDLTIDRIDNNGPYSPENCRWVTNIENCRNR